MTDEMARAGELAASLVDVVYAFRMEPDVGFEYVSPSVEAMVGYTPQEHYDDPQLGMRLLDPRDLDTLLGATKADVDESVDLLVRWIAKDGHLVWTQHRCVKRRRDDGSVVLYGAARDVTEQHAAAERYRLLAENSSDVVAVGSVSGVLEWVSPSVTGLLGWRPKDMAGRPFRDFVDPSDLPFLAVAHEALSRGEPGRVEARLRTSEGGLRWVSIALRPVLDDDGNVIERIASWRDVESEHATREALAASEERFRMLAENASDIVVEVAGDGTVAWVSPSAAGVLGWEPLDLVGTQPWGLIHPDDQAEAITSLADVAGGVVESCRLDVRVSRADGAYIWMAASGRHAAHDRVVVSFRDIDARVAAQRAAELAQQAAEAERARLRADLDSQIEPHIIMRAVRDDAGSIVDFIYEDANPAALAYLGVTMDQFRGMSLMEMYPSAAALVMRDMYSHTVETGEPLVEDDYAYPNEMYAGDIRLYDLRGAKLGDGIALSWEDVTDRSLMARRVAESERRYRLLSDHATDVVYLVGADRLVSWISPTVTSALGWDPEELVGTSLDDLIHPDDRTRIYAVREAGIRGEETENPPGGWPARFRRKDGTYTWMALKSTTVNDENSDFAYMVTGMRDVDDLVRRGEQAEYEAARRQAILETLLDPHILLESVRDESGTIVDFIYADANDAACEYNRIPRERLIGMRLLDIFPSQAGTGMLAMYADVIASGVPLVLNDHAYPHEILDEERRYDIRAVRVADALSLTWRDVTERYEAAQRLATSEEHYRLLAENSSDVVVRSRQGIIVWVSPSLTDALGWSASDWIGRTFEDFTHPDEIPALRHGRAEVDNGSDIVVTLRLRNARGEYHWVAIHAGPAVTAAGVPDGIVSSFRIVDDEVAAQELLRQRATYDDLTGALKRDPALARLQDIGHRQRTPGSETAVLFIDLDDFKSVNDTWGHATGDGLLQSVTERLRGVVRAEDTVARMGGDEFLVTLGGIHDLPEAVAIAEQIRVVCGEPVTVLGAVVATTLSIGVTLADPIESGDELIARADKAMYAAKRAGRNRVAAVPLRSGRAAGEGEGSS